MRAEDRVLIKNMARTAEIVNTINGGMAEPRIKINKGQSEWLIKIKIPGVNVDHLKIEIKDYQMFLFHVIHEPNSSDISLPYLVTAINLSRKVNFDEIVAEYENSEVFIRLPLNETESGFEREIEIFKK